jgi:hypothetical protein
LSLAGYTAEEAGFVDDCTLVLAFPDLLGAIPGLDL